MTRGGDRGGRRPKTLAAIVKKSYILEPLDDAKVREWAAALGCSESEALRQIIRQSAPQPSSDARDARGS